MKSNDWHTPKEHTLHKVEDCGCATSDKDVYSICPCGAGYTFDILDFPIFKCYDCWRSRVSPELKYLKPRKIGV